MKRIAALILFLLPLICFADSRDTLTNLPILNWTNSVDGVSFADNTAAIQALINSGGTLTTGSYNITSLSMTNSFNFNGSTITAINNSGVMLNCTTPGVTVQNVGLVGLTGTYNASGLSGVAINAANVTLTQVSVSNVSNYGIVGGAFSNETVNNCSVFNSGYIGISMITNTTAVTGIVITNNSINRASQGTSVQQACLIVRNNAGVGGSMTGSVITGNVLTQASNPTSSAGECFEIRNNVNATITGNSYAGGSIGLSMVGCTTTRSPTGTYSGQSLEAIEIVNSNNSSAGGTITSGVVGVLVDGNTTMSQDTISATTMTGLTSYPILFNISNPFVNFQVNNVSANTLTYGLYVHYASNITINNSAFVGNNSSYAILFDTSPGGMTINNSTFTNFLPKLMNTFGSVPTIVNNILTNGVSPTGSFLGINAGPNITLGSNIRFNPVVVTPPNISYPNPNTYTQGLTISPLNVTNTGSVATYSVTPALPSNLVLNTSTGQITGQALTVTPTSTFTVKAVNSAGSSSFPLVITINLPKPKISYVPSSQTYTQFSPIAPYSITNSGGFSNNFTISPALVSGLSFNNVTAQITGTPTVVQGVTTYKIKAFNSGGVDSTNISIQVNIALPSFSYSPYSNTYTTGQTITNLVPNSTGGTVSGWTISPPLPNNLSINSSTGVISGVAGVSSPSLVYTITGTNASGVGHAQIAIQINPTVPVINYVPDTVALTQFSSITPIIPVSSGGQVTNFTITPNLGSGMFFSTLNGVISGVPQIPQALTQYTIVGSNSTGSSTTHLWLSVAAYTQSLIIIKNKVGFIVFPP